MPRSGISIALMQRSNVLLPAPDGPSRQTTVPWPTDRSTPFRTTSAPRFFQTFEIRTKGLGSPWSAVIAAAALVSSGVASGLERDMDLRLPPRQIMPLEEDLPHREDADPDQVAERRDG